MEGVRRPSAHVSAGAASAEAESSITASTSNGDIEIRSNDGPDQSRASSAARRLVEVSVRSSGTTRVAPSVVMKFVSPLHRGTRWT